VCAASRITWTACDQMDLELLNGMEKKYNKVILFFFFFLFFFNNNFIYFVFAISGF